MKNSDIFHISAQNIDCRYSLEPPRRGGSNEYPHSMFLSSNKKNDVYPCKPQFYKIKVGFKGVMRQNYRLAVLNFYTPVHSLNYQRTSYITLTVVIFLLNVKFNGNFYPLNLSSMLTCKFSLIICCPSS